MTARITRKRIFIIIRAGRNQTIQGRGIQDQFYGRMQLCLADNVTHLRLTNRPTHDIFTQQRNRSTRLNILKSHN